MQLAASKKVKAAFQNLSTYVESMEFKGWDPYDSLNSRLFMALPFIHESSIFQLAWIQLFKRNPVNLRRIFLVPKEYNPKGLALFLSGYCSLYQLSPTDELKQKISRLADQLIDLQTPGYAGACWGYNFPWKSRIGYLPMYAPTVVVTSYAGYALLDAFEATGELRFLDTALSIQRFILKMNLTLATLIQLEYVLAMMSLKGALKLFFLIITANITFLSN